MLLLPQCMIRSATSRSSQINPSLRLCKVSGAKSAILATGRKTEAFNHKPLPHFLLYWDRMRRAANKTTSLICTYTLAGTAGPAAFPHGKQGRASPAILGDPLATWPWNTTSAWQQRNRHIPLCHPPVPSPVPPSCATGRKTMGSLELPGGLRACSMENLLHSIARLRVPKVKRAGSAQTRQLRALPALWHCHKAARGQWWLQ